MMIRITVWSYQRVCYFQIKVNVASAASFLADVSLKAPEEVSDSESIERIALSLPGFSDI